MTTNRKTQAVIYCRISDPGQTGLGSQEHRCRQYAEAKDYEVAAVFYDKFTGGADFMRREGMVELLKFLDDNPQTNYVVIFDDLKRYARNTYFHLGLRLEMEKRNATRECLNFNFENTPEGRFNETINAAVSELDRETIARQSRQKIIARLENGYSVISRPPVGFKYEKARGGGKVLVRDEPNASIIAEALEGYASGRFVSQNEVARFLENHPSFPKHYQAGKRMERKVADILRQPLYAGYVGSKKLGVSLRDGQHEGLISKATFQRIKERMEGRANAPARKDLHRDFPLRGAVTCSGCGNHLTASWSKGCKKHYAYYLCQTRDCDHYGKSIPRAKIEGQFEELLKGIQPSRNLVKTMFAMCRVYREMKIGRAEANKKALEAQMQETEDHIAKLVNRIVEASNERAIGAIENKIGELEQQKLILAEKAAKSAQHAPTLNDNLELAWAFLANPYSIWQKGVFDLKRLVLKLVLSEPLAYDRFEGYRTPSTALVFSALGRNSGQNFPDLGNGGR